MKVFQGNPANGFDGSPLSGLDDVDTVYQHELYASGDHNAFDYEAIRHAAETAESLTCLDLERWPVHSVWTLPDGEDPAKTRLEYLALFDLWRLHDRHATRLGMYNLLPRAGARLDAKVPIINAETDMLCEEMMPSLDVLFPSLYVRFDTTRVEIRERTRVEIGYQQQADRPIYPFIHQRYHPSHADVDLRLRYIGEANLRALLDELGELGVAGVVWWDYPLKTYLGGIDKPGVVDHLSRDDYEEFYRILLEYNT